MDYMELALEEAKKAYEEGEVPIGVVIVKDGEIIARAHNEKEQLNDATAHGEILAIKRASEKLDSWRLYDTEMYVTLEPCPMCTSAITQSRIGKVYFGSYNRDMGGCGSVIDLISNKFLNTHTEFIWSNNEECKDIVTEFFRKRRKEK